MAIFAATALTAAATVLAIQGHDWLPPLFRDRQALIPTNLIIANLALIALQLVAAASLLRQRRSVLDMWLLVALCAWLVHALLNLQTSGRFTVLFYCQYGLLLFAHLVVMLALVAESTRLYARLALSSAARAREHDTRLLSLDAVAAAIGHEVGQSLTGVILNANAGLSSANQAAPDGQSAMAQSLRAVLEDATRTFEVLKNIRAMFAGGMKAAAEFNLNDLVCETEALLRRELAVAKVSLRMALDETLPPILANKVQIQQVLINLLSNAVESLSKTSGSPRSITVRTSAKGRYALLEISDTGVGIEFADIKDVFQAFFTTKTAGTGLGLSLCRTIVDQHGGRLWVTSNKEQGVTFHVELRCSSLPAE